MTTKTDDCIDCVREGKLVPEKKYKKTSYCMPHNSARSASSTSAAKIRVIIQSKNWNALKETDRYGAPKFPYDTLAGAIAHFREIGRKAVTRAQLVPESERMLDARTPNPEFAIPYDEAYEALVTAENLLQKRELTGVETAAIREQIIPSDREELERIDRANNRAVEPSVERGPVGVGNENVGVSVNDKIPGRPR